MSNGNLQREGKVGTLMDDLNHFWHFECGIGGSLAGIALLMICLINWLMGSGFLSAALSIGLLTGWVYCNHAFRKYYSSLGDVTIPQAAPVRYHQPRSVVFFILKNIDWLILRLLYYWHKAVATCLSLVIAFCLIPIIASGNIFRPTTLIISILLISLIVIVWCSLRSPIEVITVYLLILACVSSVEGSLGAFFYLHSTFFLLFSSCLILVGAVGHWHFCCLEKDFAEV